MKTTHEVAMTRRARRTARVVALAGAVLALLGGAIDRAGAAFPGENGKIAFSRYDTNQEVYVMNADGSGVTNLTQHPAHDGNPEWSPDGSKIAFASSRNGPANYEIYVMDADGSGATRLTENGWNDGNPTWSPDGSKIAFAGNGPSNVSELYVMNADGSGLTQLTSNTEYDLSPTWSPDGSKIAFDRIVTGGGYEVFVMNADGSGQANLTQHPGNDQAPSWSPDGSQIAFNSYRDGNWEIYVMDADGSGQTNVTQSGTKDENFPRWAPSGTRIAFNRYVDAGLTNSEIFAMNADGSGEVQLTQSPAIDFDVSWQTVPSADLAVSLAATPDTARSGKPLTYVISVLNAGASNAQGVVVTDTLPEGARFVSAQPSRGSCVTPAPGATGTITCSLGFIPSTTTVSTEVVVKVVVKRATIVNSASVSSSTPDPNVANNSATIATQVR